MNSANRGRDVFFLAHNEIHTFFLWCWFVPRSLMAFQKQFQRPPLQWRFHREIVTKSNSSAQPRQRNTLHRFNDWYVCGCGIDNFLIEKSLDCGANDIFDTFFHVTTMAKLYFPASVCRSLFLFRNKQIIQGERRGLPDISGITGRTSCGIPNWHFWSQQRTSAIKKVERTKDFRKSWGSPMIPLRKTLSWWLRRFVEAPAGLAKTTLQRTRFRDVKYAIIWDTDWVDDDRTKSDYNIQKKRTLYLELRRRGEMKLTYWTIPLNGETFNTNDNVKTKIQRNINTKHNMNTWMCA